MLKLLFSFSVFVWFPVVMFVWSLGCVFDLRVYWVFITECQSVIKLV